MACTRWEEQGLLFSSGELDQHARDAYAEHLASCEECRTEMSTYERERQRFYTGAILEETTSAAVDKEILRVCSNARTPLTGIGVFAGLLAKPVALAFLFLAVGLGTGTYIAYHVDNSQNLAAKLSPVSPPAVASDTSLNAAPRIVSATGSGSADSLARDSARDMTPFPRGRVGAASSGVVPVDLQKH